MNRYTFLFALLVASSFAVQTPQAGGRSTTASNAADRDSKNKSSHPARRDNAAAMEGPEPFVRAFLAKALDKAGPGQGPAILFATVPHPLETHMAAEFDHDLDGLQDALQESGYLYDSSWIPWKLHEPRDRFNDDQSEEVAKTTEDGLPGIVMFRSADRSKDAFFKRSRGIRDCRHVRTCED